MIKQKLQTIWRKFKGWILVVLGIGIALAAVGQLMPNDKPQYPIELPAKRTLNSKTFNNGNGTFTGEFHIGHIHYKDRKTRKFEPINVKFREEAGEFIVDEASYQIKIPKKLNKVKFFANEKWMDIEPIGIRQNIEGRITDDPETSHKGNTVRFDNVYGQGIHLEFVVRTGSVKKYIVFDQKPTKFDWKFRLTGFNKEKHILWKPRIFDSNGKSQDVEYDITGRILTKHLSESFFDDAVYPIRTDTTTSYYAGAGDGNIYANTLGQPSQANWDTTHDAATGAGVVYTGAYDGRGKIPMLGVSNNLYIHRVFFPIDTSGLGATAVVSAAILKTWSASKFDDYNGSGYDYVAIVQTDQPDTTELTTADFNNCGATDNPDKGSADFDITGLTADNSAYNDLTLNETGRGWIQKEGTTMLGLRAGQDIQDIFEGDPGETDKNSGIECYTSENTDTSKDPYLSVTYTVAAEVVPAVIMFD